MTITSLSKLGTAWNNSHKNKVKIKKSKPAAVRECPNCGGELRNISGTNVWVCDFHKLTDEDLGENKVQVFSKCNFQVFD